MAKLVREIKIIMDNTEIAQIIVDTRSKKEKLQKKFERFDKI